ncbi:flagellar biosynthetic protein FliO [Aliidiomarina celeris]|uniref:flagellar biosynthetic protein FliO n=1 Tax=Aliidiomarina celeris TaxID=2249428 RepID=UPI000DE992D0|nr:flagellar biosynthetic protein FliO [Aliidiomarina celeris]
MNSETTAGAGLIGWGDIASMIFMLAIVLALIFILAWLARRFNITSALPARQGIKVVASHSLGTKEKLVVVEVANEQLLLGVTAHNIRLLKTLPANSQLTEPQKGK